MITLYDKGVLIDNGEFSLSTGVKDAEYFKGTMAYSVLNAHNDNEIISKAQGLRLKFDALASHDITYVGIIQTAKASGLKEFPIPYVLTNCHNSLCAVGGTINEDDHVYGLSAARKYGGIFVPPHLAVIHTYMRESMARCGGMILGSDSHTRYGALGTLAVGEGGPELVKQLLNKTYDIKYPDVVAVILRGAPRRGVGPQDVALTIIKAVYDNKLVNNKIMEFIGEGIGALSVEYRNGIDVMTTETTCLSSIWKTDAKVKEYYKTHQRLGDYREISPAKTAYYDGAVVVDLDKIQPMIALPFHPKNAYTIKGLGENLEDILAAAEAEGNMLLNGKKAQLKLRDKIVNRRLKLQQGIIAGCAGGTYDNIFAASNILNGKSVGSGDFSLSVYPSSQPIYSELLKRGALSRLISAGAIIKTAFCGPCFGAGDVPRNNALSIRHTTRNFESREGSKPSDGQIASVALMDSRSIAATAMNGGFLTSALDVDYDDKIMKFRFDGEIYKNRVYQGFGKADKSSEIVYGPSISDWPKLYPLADTLILKLAAVINDSVTTTDELIPSGETSSYRSNPLRLAEFTLSRKDPEYVGRAKEIQRQSLALRAGGETDSDLDKALRLSGVYTGDISEEGKKALFKDNVCALGSVVFAKKPGDGSAREQAASCQRVLGGAASIANSYATKRYRSNLINWGMPPFLSDAEFEVGDIVVVKDLKRALTDNMPEFDATLFRNGSAGRIVLRIDPLTNDERDIILKGCLINYYA